MAEELYISTGADKEQRYKDLLPQIKALLDSEADEVARLGNFCAALKQAFNWLWVGFYRVNGSELVLGPFQGPLACTRIKLGKGVCGTAWQKNQTLVVPDVDAFPGHISCSSLSRSEIVLPVRNKTGEVIMVLDIDSQELNQFNETDEKYLSQLLTYI